MLVPEAAFKAQSLAVRDVVEITTWGLEGTGAAATTLADAAVVYDCKLIEAKEVATHMVLFGEVQAIRLGDSGPALIYMNRSYHTV